MPAKKQNGSIDPAKTYDVKMAKAVKYGETWLRPSSARVRLSGTVLETIKDAVASYEEVK